MQPIFGDAANVSNGSTLRTITTAYDAASQITSISDPSSTINFTLDNLGRATTHAQSVNGLTPTVMLNQAFDARNNRTELKATIASTLDRVQKHLARIGKDSTAPRVSYIVPNVGWKHFTIAIVTSVIGFIFLWAGPRETWVGPEVVGRIDYTDAGASRECIMANIRLDGEVLPIAIEESGRFRALPVKAYRFAPDGDRTSSSLIEIWTCDGKGVEYEMGLDQHDFSCDDTPKTYLILVYFTSSGNPILRAMYLPGRVRKTIGSSELQKYIDRLDNRREFEEWLERDTRAVGSKPFSLGLRTRTLC